MIPLQQRPEARWALWAGIAGAIAAAAVQARAIFASPHASAALGFVFVPLLILLAAVAAGIWGLAVGHIVARLRGAVSEPWIVFAAACVAAASLPLALAYELWRSGSP